MRHWVELPAVRVERQVVARRRNKMGAKKVRAYVGNQDCKFDSQAEWKYALWLEGQVKAGLVDQWVHHPGRISLYGAHMRVVSHMEPDFAVWLPGNPVHEYHEVKGMATAAWRLKRALFEAVEDRPYVVIDAGHVNPPLLFDDRRKRKAARKKFRNGAKLTPKRKKASTRRTK